MRNVSAGFRDSMKIKHQFNSDHAKSSAPASKNVLRCSKHNMNRASMSGFDSRCNEITTILKDFERILKGFVSPKVRNVSAGFQDSMKIEHYLKIDHAKSSAPASKNGLRCCEHSMHRASMSGFDSRCNDLTVVVGSRSKQPRMPGHRFV